MVADDRVRSKLFVNQRNADSGYRVWNDLAGFSFVKEYDDIKNAGGDLQGLMGDDRLVVVSTRKIEDMGNAAKSLGIRSTMSFTSVSDVDSGLELCGIGWQESGRGDVFLSVAVLFGVAAGNQGGAPGSMTDQAGCRITTNP